MTADAAACVRLSHGGGLRGSRLGSLAVFRGIPYARAPREALRFEAPQPADPWTGPRDATAFAPVPPQWPRRGGEDARMLGALDCLALNVWTPEPREGAGLPVMVWIPGGGFMRGGASDPLYDGAAFARQGIVFVSVQYRIGVDGFMHFGDEAPANRGLLDQLAALRWVRDHIAAFGGDPGRVTAFGESAGAGSIACLMGMDTAQGLFRRAILQSPSVACQTEHDAEVARRAVARLLDVQPTLGGVAGAPLRDVLYAVHRLAGDAALRERHGISRRNFFPLRPVVDGRVLAQAPLEALRRQWAARRSPLQVLVGSNAEEMRLYHVPDGAIERITDDEVAAFMDDVGLPVAARATYGPMAVRQGAVHPGEMLCAMQSDYYYRVPARRIASLAAERGMAAYAYELEWRSPQWNGQLGAAHGVDLPFVFGNLHTSTGRELTGAQAPQALADAMQGAWVRFVHGGHPGWPAHRPGAPWLQHFDHAPRWGMAPACPRLTLWDGLA
ncbi:carboxylesterase family protein [Acidovorax sp. GBBC 3334]|uniref:carboxylesterase/lipase family protein n=1 Tax=Acidovorax sp. GBBC 3334 TaxID=2940496 RepID=UPI0023041C4F|nr:carboxylesterase family protein [Acidovorax sp. GBBC 3334]MDA8455699.1 carboxylesterase family protein [Acidovorax sp. GBBC 3334]